MKKTIKFIDLFAGIGGFHEGMTRAGHECVGFCEYDKYAVASYTSMYLITEKQREYLATLPLKQRQQEILKEEYRNGMWYRQDIRTIKSWDVPRADIWCFGAPCQDFSLAGSRIGLEGDRSSLVGQVFRLVDEISEEMRPRWLVYENVKGMLSSNRGLDYLAILSEMDRLGYQPDPGYSIPQVTSNTWDYYALNGWYVGTYDRNTARNVIFAQIDSGSEYVHLKFSDEESFLAAWDDVLNSDFTNEILQYKAETSQVYELSYGTSYDDALYTIDINWVC